ncbi:MAG: hypothetical protein BM557_02205 [Flavobacterium sp. MedPE-SWcel]|uniref:hypothetical protein n=1 Tax=uncultured Flavobacterium sp. TaxID=165435 RepID=UPI00091C8EF7|nr:hypothetical protein [uncultured Flavobacterium sp.]OIQ22211.1 MAG: hypothetical protein BM557_02205 [Flavobacterium sp. MedPE-SWcel]
MPNFFSKFKPSTIKYISDYRWIYIFICGLFFILLSYSSFCEEIEFLPKALNTSGITMITATVFTTIVKSKQFTEIFSKQLREIIYCTEHLEKRKDIRDLWISASKAMYRKNFPELCDKIELNIEKYIPVDSSKYYENYVYKVDISFDKENKNFIILKERESFDLISRTKDKVDYKSSCLFSKENYEDNITDYKMRSFQVNGTKIDSKKLKLTVDKNHNGNKVFVNHTRNLKGKNKYSIKKEETKIYSLKVENTKSHICSHIFHNYTLEVTHPKELDVDFYENGTLNNFERLQDRTVGDDDFKVQRFEYNGIMFKNQGTRIIFRDKRVYK